eukprot:CAMPEP_0196788606 /NCGR_PEP_ID=MMETSP1104-20130614/25228_1 /TAXON_ID=33652 /ORGANISM="Cafeteria sp., Strain Caron Lab Isolate" /LENGTH=74 /DNA_ID=CAMNT_0042158953 /DNA_START=116 /DNA_END=337 /DNA_ORIENTATION=-
MPTINTLDVTRCHVPVELPQQPCAAAGEPALDGVLDAIRGPVQSEPPLDQRCAGTLHLVSLLHLHTAPVHTRAA